jgi:hypothetical protein
MKAPRVRRPELKSEPWPKPARSDTPETSEREPVEYRERPAIRPPKALQTRPGPAVAARAEGRPLAKIRSWPWPVKAKDVILASG